MFGNEFVKFVNCHKHFKVTFEACAGWDTLIENIIPKCSKMIGTLRKLKFTVSRKCLHRMHTSLIRTILEYSDEVWDVSSELQSEQLEHLHQEAYRIVTGLTRSIKLEYLYAEVGWVSLCQRGKEQRNRYLKKNVK